MHQQRTTQRLKRDLHNVVSDVERILQDMSDTAGEQTGELKSRASKQLLDVRTRLGEMEHATAAGLRAAGRHSRDYARRHPWALVGGAAAIALLVVMAARSRR